MKNIHVLPTDKPSRICKNEFGTFYLTESMESKISFFKNQNIYITSDEEIKEGDYWIYICPISGLDYGDNGNPIVKNNLPNTWFNKLHDKLNYKNIILTTDQDLIKDGVQAIDDEFIGWFIKNPSCESVEVVEDIKYFNIDELRERHIKGLPHLYSEKIGYKIIIPKEEAKQETLEEANELEYYFESDIIMLECINEMASTGKVPKRWSWFLSKISDLYKQQKGYSEEEVDRILRNFRTDFLPIGQVNDLVFNEWFEQFKKK